MAVGQKILYPTIENTASGFSYNQYAMWDGAAFVGRGTPNQVTVGATGADFTTIQAACTYVAAQSPSSSNLWRIIVQAGHYVCSAIVIPSYTALMGVMPSGGTGRAYYDPHAPTLDSDPDTVTSGAFISMGTLSVMMGLNVRFNSPTGGATGECMTIYNGSGSQADVTFCYVEMRVPAGTFATSVVKADTKLQVGRSTLILISTPATNARGAWAAGKEIGLFYSVLAYNGADATGPIAAFQHDNSNISDIFFDKLWIETAGFNWQTCLVCNAGSIQIGSTPYTTSTGSGQIVHWDTVRNTTSGVLQAAADTDVPAIFKAHSPTQTGNLWQTQTSSGSVQIYATTTGSLVTPALAMQNGAAAGKYLKSLDSSGNAQWADLPATTQYWTETSGSLYPSNASDLTILTGGLKSPWSNTVIVDKNGKGDFTTVKAACDYVTANGNTSSTNMWNVLIYNGVYTENPFIVPQYTNVRGFHAAGLSSPFNQSVEILASTVTWTGGSFLYLNGISSSLSNLTVVAQGTYTFSSDPALVTSANNARIDGCYLHFSSVNAFTSYTVYGAGLFISNTVIAANKGGSGSAYGVYFTTGGQLRDCWLRFTPTSYIYNASGTSSIFFTRLGESAGPNSTIDINVASGTVMLNNSPYKTGNGTITVVDGIPNFVKAVANTNTPSGATAFAQPIYDATGVLKGYMPIYTSQW